MNTPKYGKDYLIRYDGEGLVYQEQLPYGESSTLCQTVEIFAGEKLENLSKVSYLAVRDGTQVETADNPSQSEARERAILGLALIKISLAARHTDQNCSDRKV